MRYLMILLAVTACSTAQERAQSEARAAIEREAPYCEALGYSRYTEGWRACIEKRAAARDAGTICSVVYGTLICN